VRHTKDENQSWWHAFSEERADALLKLIELLQCSTPLS